MATPSPSDRGPSEPNHYELLRLPESATPQQLRAAFRRLSKLYHPDTTPLPLAQASQSFQQLQQAYAVLSDPVARRAYDLRRLGSSRPAETAPVSSAPGPAGSSGPTTPGGAARGFPASRGPGPHASTTTRTTSVRRALSGGEWFALLLLAIALLLSLALGIGLAWARGTELMRQPSWWTEGVADPVGNTASMGVESR